MNIGGGEGNTTATLKRHFAGLPTTDEATTGKSNREWVAKKQKSRTAFGASTEEETIRTEERIAKQRQVTCSTYADGDTNVRVSLDTKTTCPQCGQAFDLVVGTEVQKVTHKRYRGEIRPWVNWWSCALCPGDVWWRTTGYRGPEGRPLGARHVWEDRGSRALFCECRNVHCRTTACLNCVLGLRVSHKNKQVNQQGGVRPIRPGTPKEDDGDDDEKEKEKSRDSNLTDAPAAAELAEYEDM